MREIIETRSIPCAGDYEVLVLGGGVAGVAAALSARRLGARVLLVEKSAMLGGLATLGLINYYEPICDGEGFRITSGLVEELLRLSIQDGFSTLPQAWQNGGARPSPESARERYAAHFSPSIFSLVLNERLCAEGIDIRYDMVASYPVMAGSHCQGVIVESKNGREYYLAQTVIDTTGDADIVHRAGAPCLTGENFLTYTAHGCTLESARMAAERGDMRHLRGGRFWMGSDLNGNGQPEGLSTVSGTTNAEITQALMLGQQMLLDRLRESDAHTRDVLTLPGMVQFRKTRCLQGALVFSDDVLHQTFADTVGATGDFRTRGPQYEVPYRCLYHPAYENLFAAGRCASASGDGWEILRVIPTAVLTGEAAGAAAALCVREKQAAAALDVGQLQAALLEKGVTLHKER